MKTLLCIPISLLLVLATSSAAIAQQKRPQDCHIAILSGYTQPQPDSPVWSGPIRMRIGNRIVDGTVEAMGTEGFGNVDWNPYNENIQEVGTVKVTYDFGDEGMLNLWTFETWTYWPPYDSGDLSGRMTTGPHRDDVEHIPYYPWGTGRFADADAEMKLRGWIDFEAENPDGSTSPKVSFFHWGRICYADITGLGRPAYK